MKTKTFFFAVATIAFADAIYLAVSFSFAGIWPLILAVAFLTLLSSLCGVLIDADDDRATVCNTVKFLRKIGLRKLAHKYANLSK